MATYIWCIKIFFPIIESVQDLYTLKNTIEEHKDKIRATKAMVKRKKYTHC